MTKKQRTALETDINNLSVKCMITRISIDMLEEKLGIP